MSDDVKIDDYKVNGAGFLKRLWRKITRADDKKDGDNSYLMTNQSGSSIAKSEAITLDGDSTAEVIFKGDEKFNELMNYSLQVGQAIDNRNPDLLPKGHGFTPKQIERVFYGNQQQKEMTLSENFNLHIGRVAGGYDTATSKRIDIRSLAYEDQYLAELLKTLPDESSNKLGERIWNNAEKVLNSISYPAHYDDKPEHTKNLGGKNSRGWVCRHQSAAGAAMLSNAGVEAVAFSNYIGGMGEFLSGKHLAVYFPATRNIADFTASPADSYYLNVFGNDLNGSGAKGIIYTISAANPKDAPTVYDPTQESEANPIMVSSMSHDAFTKVLQQEIKVYGSDKLKDYLMSKDNPRIGAPREIIRPENTNGIEMLAALGERAMQIAKERHPEAHKLLVKFEEEQSAAYAREVANNRPSSISSKSNGR